MPGSVHSSVSKLRQLWPDVPRQVGWALISGQVPTLCLNDNIVSPLWLQWVKGVHLFRCNLPPTLLEEWPGSFTCHCSNTGVERTPTKSQHTKFTLEKKILPMLLPGFELTTFQSRVQHSYHIYSVWESSSVKVFATCGQSAGWPNTDHYMITFLMSVKKVI